MLQCTDITKISAQFFFFWVISIFSYLNFTQQLSELFWVIWILATLKPVMSQIWGKNIICTDFHIHFYLLTAAISTEVSKSQVNKCISDKVDACFSHILTVLTHGSKVPPIYKVNHIEHFIGFKMNTNHM